MGNDEEWSTEEFDGAGLKENWPEATTLQASFHQFEISERQQHFTIPENAYKSRRHRTS